MHHMFSIHLSFISFSLPFIPRSAAVCAEGSRRGNASCSHTSPLVVLSAIVAHYRLQQRDRVGGGVDAEEWCGCLHLLLCAGLNSFHDLSSPSSVFTGDFCTQSLCGDGFRYLSRKISFFFCLACPLFTLLLVRKWICARFV